MNGLRILLTGAAGLVGGHTLALLVDEGHIVTATDMLPESSVKRPEGTLGKWTYRQADLTSLPDVDGLFDAEYDAVIHLGAVPNPLTGMDHRTLHANNVVGNYNVLRTAVDKGIKRIVQASSVNAHGLGYAPPGHTKFDKFPIDEDVPRRDEDAYALSKHIGEIQADSLVRLVPGVRIASLRPHMVREDYASAFPDCESGHLFSWVSYAALARACLLGVTSEGWDGHEVFHIVAPEICWEGSVERQETTMQTGENVPTLDLVAHYCNYKPQIDVDYFTRNPRAALWVCTKAERLLGWKHDL